MLEEALSRHSSLDVPSERAATRTGLSVDLRTTAAGVIAFDPLSDHRLKIHVGPPVRGACRAHRFVYTPGDVDIFPAGMSDVWHEDDPSTSLVVQVAPALLEHAAEDMGLPLGQAGLAPRHQFRDPQIEHIAWALQAERDADVPSGRLYAQSLALALAARLIARHRIARPLERRLSPRQLQRLTEYVDAHLDEDLSLAALARVAETSASYLKTLFKRSTGLSVHEYVVRRRVDRAKALLVRGGLPASQVALEAGFAHQSHMARCMRRVLGIIPSALIRHS